MRRILAFVVLPAALTVSCERASPPPAEPEAQWREIEARYPEFSRGYRAQQGLLLTAFTAVERAANDTAARRVAADTATLVAIDWCQLLERRGIVGLNCPRTIDTAAAAARPSVRECFQRFLRCESAGQPADCDRDWGRCVGTER